MNRRPGAAATEPDGSGVRSAERLARYDLSASSGGRVGVTVVVHCRPKERPGAIRAAGAGWTLPRAGGNILMPSVERSLSPPGPMPAHSIGSATISFGLVSVPIKMFSAGESSAAISFNCLHKKDGARLKQQYVCSKDGEKVEKEDMIKGYEFAKGRYVQFTPDELKALEEKGTGSINITEFVDADTVDRMYMDRVYFMGPDKGGDRAFTLLGEALKKTRKVA